MLGFIFAARKKVEGVVLGAKGQGSVRNRCDRSYVGPCFPEMSRVGGEWKSEHKPRLAPSAQSITPKLEPKLLQAMTWQCERIERHR